MYSKKGQAGMMEMFVVLIIIFIIIGFGMYVFFKASISGTKEQAEGLCVMTATSQLKAILYMPELICSSQAHIENYCIDVFKVIAYKGAESKGAIIAGNCPVKVVIEQAYPEPNGDRECDMVRPGMDKNCKYIVLYEPSEGEKAGRETEIITSTPVSLYYPEKDEYAIGRLVISSYAYA
ncbi:MAG: hypothetical protein ABIB71_01395 [Candidatus Woesearchaeota archaeon]